MLGALGLREAGFGAPDRPRSARLVDRARRRGAAAAGPRQLRARRRRVARRWPRAARPAAPTLAVLATSREPLGLTGETLLPLTPLPLPGHGPTRAGYAGGPAVRRPGRRRAARLRPRRGNRAASSRICAALDGLPLAIELAAARLRQFPVVEVAARLPARPVPVAVPRRPHRRGPPPHAARGRRVELGPARPDGAAARQRGSRCSPAARRSPAVEAVCGPAASSDVLAEPRRQVARRDRRRARTGCWRRSGSSAPSSSRRPARRTEPGARTPRYHLDLPARPIRTCAGPSSSTGWPGSTPSTTTSTAALRWAVERRPPTGVPAGRRAVGVLVAAAARHAAVVPRRPR